MEAKKYPLIYLISLLFIWGSCSKPHEQTSVSMFQYQLYDLEYNHTLYIGVSYVCGDEKNNPQYIVCEIDDIKELYELYGIDSLLTEFKSWHYHQNNPTQWTLPYTQKTISWNDASERYIIYLALRNNYVVYRDDETGYLCFDKQ